MTTSSNPQALSPDNPSSSTVPSGQPLNSTQPPVPPLGSGPGTSTVFDLLSRLNPGSASGSQLPPPQRTQSIDDNTQKPLVRTSGGSSSTLDLRYMTVQQALPHISKLVQRDEFRDKVKKVRHLHVLFRKFLVEFDEFVSCERNKTNLNKVCTLTNKKLCESTSREWRMPRIGQFASCAR